MEKSWKVLELVSSKVCDAWSVGKGEEGGTMDQSWSATVGFVPLKGPKCPHFPFGDNRQCCAGQGSGIASATPEVCWAGLHSGWFPEWGRLLLKTVVWS